MSEWVIIFFFSRLYRAAKDSSGIKHNSTWIASVWLHTLHKSVLQRHMKRHRSSRSSRSLISDKNTSICDSCFVCTATGCFHSLMFFFHRHRCEYIIIIIFTLSSIHVSNWCLYSRLPASKLCRYIIYILSFFFFSIFLAAASISGAPEWSASSPAPLTFELQVTVGAPCDEALYRSLNILWVRTDITGKCKAAHHKEVMHVYYWWVNWLMFNLLIKMWYKWSAAYIFVLFIIVLPLLYVSLFYICCFLF